LSRAATRLAQQVSASASQPPALLREMAEKGETFYSRFGVKTKEAA
jgi:3-hydroxyacyl-CoA dehydrogenase/enoyl-CoA hydratase/3-hydroxybutyryl-CoA epimerase